MTTQQLTVAEKNGGQLQAAFGAFSPAVLGQQVQLIQQAMATVMEDGVHYGVIPGTERKDKSGRDISKPTLYKPGAEKLGFMFRLAPEFPTDIIDLGGGHREYRVTCRLISINSGTFVGEAKGCCSTMESKYRYRYSDAYEVTDLPIPKDSKERKSEYRKQGYGMKKVGDEWKWVKFSGSGDKVENPDIADTYNTCLKMAMKRAHVAAILLATAASDIFTQDLEDFASDEPQTGPKTMNHGTVQEPAAVTDWKRWLESKPNLEAFNSKLPELAGLANGVKNKVKDMVSAYAKSYGWVMNAGLKRYENPAEESTGDAYEPEGATA